MPSTFVYGFPYPEPFDPPDGPAQLRALAEAVETTLANNFVRKGDLVTNAADYGAVGDGITNSTTALQSAINNAPAGGTVLIPAGLYIVGNSITINKPLTLLAYGATIATAVGGITVLRIISGDVAVLGLTVAGPGGSYVANSIGIAILGSSAAVPIRNVTLRDVGVRDVPFRGIYAEHVRGIVIDNAYVRSIVYSGIGFWSVAEGSITNCRIQSITNNGYPNNNAYGIELSRRETSNLSSEPRTSDILVSGNLVTDVPTWEGIDTHAGSRIRVIGNTILRCMHGIAMVGGNDGSGAPAFAPIDCVVAHNTIASGASDGSRSSGVQFTGALASGSAAEYATGAVIGNTVLGHGNDVSGTAYHGAIRCHTSRGLVVQGNVVREPAVAGINMVTQNHGFVVANNITLETWTNAHTATASIVIRDGGNNGLVIGNVHKNTGTKSGASVRNQRGLWVATATATNLDVHGNDFHECALPYVANDDVIYGGMFEGRGTRPTVTGSRGGNAALTSLLTALESIGVIDDSTS